VTSQSLALEVPLNWNIEKPSRVCNSAMERWGKTEGETAIPFVPSNKSCYFMVYNSKLEGKFRPFKSFADYLNTQV